MTLTLITTYNLHSSLVQEYMWHRKHTYIRLDGSSKLCDRRDMVADFQTRSDIFVFLLSTRAGGLGINLTAADTVSDSRTRGAKNNYKYISTKNTAVGQSFFPKTLKDWNKLDNETKESSTTLEVKNSIWTSHR